MSLSIVRDPEEERDVEIMAGKSLAAASQDALDGEAVTGGEATQEALIPACKMRFVGVNHDSIKNVPNLKEKVRFVVEGVVVAHEERVSKQDGEVRTHVKIETTSVEPYDGE